MTLIACTVKNEIPFMISDLLFSNMIGRENMQVPTNNFSINKFYPENLVYKPMDLMQKIYILKKNLCLVLGGFKNEMTDLLIEFRKYTNEIEEANISEDEVVTFLKSYDFKNRFQKSSFGLLFIDFISETIRAAKLLTSADWDLTQAEIFGDIHVWGSGTETFLKVITHPGTFKSAFEEDNVLTIFQKNTCLIAQILAREKVTLQTLLEGWGGGFETVYYNKDSLEKADDIAYIINHGEFDGVDIGIPKPKVILYHKYINDVLYITALEIYRHETYVIDNDIIMVADVGNYSANLHIVPSIETSKEINKLPTDFSFETIKIAMGYFIIGKENIPYYPAYFTHHSEITVKFEYDKRIEIIVKKDFNDEINTAAKMNM